MRSAVVPPLFGRQAPEDSADARQPTPIRARQAFKRRLQRAAPGGEADLRQLAGGLHRGGDEMGAARHAVVVGARRRVARRRDLSSAGARGRGVGRRASRERRAWPSSLRAAPWAWPSRPPRGFAAAAFAGADAAVVAFAPARSRRALRRCGRVLGRLPKTSRSPLPPEEESLEAMAMILPHRSSEAPRAPKLETNSPVSRISVEGKALRGRNLERMASGAVSSPATLGLYVWAGYARDRAPQHPSQ